MNLCNFGIHDYEEFRDYELIKSKLFEYLERKGFENINDLVFKKDNVVLETWCPFEGDDIESCIPRFDCLSKVCVNCGKIKLTYSLDACIVRLQTLIDKKTNAYERRAKAERIRNESLHPNKRT